MGHCPDSVRAELLAEVLPKIQAFVDVRVQEESINASINEEAILCSCTMQSERISSIADAMNKYYGSNWADAYPERYKAMEQELRLQGFSMF
jgi:hypothetical protein